MTTTGSRPRGPLLLVAALLVLVGVAVGVVLLGDEPQRAVLRDTSRTVDQDRGAATARLVEELEEAITDGDLSTAEELAGADDARGRAELRTLVRNVERLGLERVAFRYVAPVERGLSDAEQRRYGDDAWLSEVQVTWQVGGVDARTSTLDVPVVTSGSAEDAVFESFRASGGRTPLWLSTALVRRSVGDATVLAPRTRVGVLTRQAVRAVRTVRRTVPEWRGPLVVEAAPGTATFRAASGLSRQAAEQIAAVTATTDGSALEDTPVHVFVNPSVFSPLGPRGQQIVLSHEAAHVALGAARTSAPLWLSEGVADYVALVDSPIPVRVLAAQILRRVDEEGAPRTLPGQEEFDDADAALGAWYEASWLAARLVAERYGEAALLDLYRTAHEGDSLDAAFRDVLGTTEVAFTREWRSYLDELAG